MLNLVKATHHYEEQLKEKKAELLAGGNINPHDQFWERGKIAGMPQQVERARIINFMLENNL